MEIGQPDSPDCWSGESAMMLGQGRTEQPDLGFIPWGIQDNWVGMGSAGLSASLSSYQPHCPLDSHTDAVSLTALFRYNMFV